MKKRMLITGGSGFIGTAVIRLLIEETDHLVLNLDNLSYAGNLESLIGVSSNPRYRFVKGDVCDRVLVSKLFKEFNPDVVMHLAAESHVDRSIDSPTAFIQTNIVGTSVMLECARKYWANLSSMKDSVSNKIFHDDIGHHSSLATTPCATKESFRFHHISTDEVYGTLGNKGFFTEETAYKPNSPYSASKASSDHLVRAWHRTYGLPVLITNCSNNFGPYQFPEKLIPLMILNALQGKPLPVYGNGLQIRDWLYVDDHARALFKVVSEGQIGETYNIGGYNEKTNLEVVYAICEILEELVPMNRSQDPLVFCDQDEILIERKESSLTKQYIVEREIPTQSYKDLITYVTDRPGHDQRYAIDASKIQNDLGWTPEENFETGLKKTVEWYLKNADWCQRIQNKGFQHQRLGITGNQKEVIG